MDWLCMTRGSERGAARFGSIENYEHDFKLKQSIPLRDTFPTDARVRMRRAAPDEIELVDCLNTAASAAIVSARVCQLFEEEGIDNIELLPIAAIDHKGREAKERYFVVNILSSVDCIDFSKSQVTWNSIDPTLVRGVSKLALDEAKINADIKLCRLGGMKYQSIIHRSVVEKIRAAKMRGFAFTEVADFTRS